VTGKRLRGQSRSGGAEAMLRASQCRSLSSLAKRSLSAVSSSSSDIASNSPRRADFRAFGPLARQHAFFFDRGDRSAELARLQGALAHFFSPLRQAFSANCCFRSQFRVVRCQFLYPRCNAGTMSKLQRIASVWFKPGKHIALGCDFGFGQTLRKMFMAWIIEDGHLLIR
jgi:hypothetical protein